MTLEERINKDIITAMKERDVLKRETLKYIKSQIQIVRTQKNPDEITDAKIVKIMEKSIEGMREVGNEESLAQLDILKFYIPEKMSEDDIRKEIEILVKNGAQNIGDVMKEFSIKFSGKADNRIVSTLAKELLR